MFGPFLDHVWTKLRPSLDLVWTRAMRGHVAGTFYMCCRHWTRFRHVFVMFQRCFGHISEMIRAWFAYHPGIIWASPRHVWGIYFQLLKYLFSKCGYLTFRVFFSEIWDITTNQTKGPSHPTADPTRGGIRGRLALGSLNPAMSLPRDQGVLVESFMI